MFVCCLSDEDTEKLLLVCLFVSNLIMFVFCLSDEDTEELLLVCLFVSNLIRCLYVDRRTHGGAAASLSVCQ